MSSDQPYASPATARSAGLKENGARALPVRDGSSRSRNGPTNDIREQVMRSALKLQSELDRVADRVEPLPDDAIPLVRNVLLR
jgi:hypothetical protein